MTASRTDAPVERLLDYSPENRQHVVHEAADELLRLSGRVQELERALKGLRHTWHYECDDPWYSCPKDPSYIGKSASGECTCGTDEQNAKIDAALAGGDKG